MHLGDCCNQCCPVDGGPEQLFIFVDLKKGSSIEPDKLKILFSWIIQSNLNPLFKITNGAKNLQPFVLEIRKNKKNKRT
ncbi:putative acyl-activating enzyme 18 [Quercus suber]|uniref:Acyl-activating enzyme 18 n=1 Tax=Quercus suber TaxID=58331 RepID=A0AAW0L2N3_QUESU